LQQQTTPAVPLPNSAQQQVQQAHTAVLAAYTNGVKRQHVELLLPLIGATDLDDWPGGIRQQFKAAQPMVESILKVLKVQPGLVGPLDAALWDEGDACGVWLGQKLGAILFPSSSVIEKLKVLVLGAKTGFGGTGPRKDPKAPDLLFIVNPQWENSNSLLPGQSDFGIFGRAESEALVASFVPTYQLRQLRIYGDDIRLLKAYPHDWQIHVLDKKGGSELIGTMKEQPSYAQIEALLKARPSSMMNQSLYDRLRSEWDFNQDSLNNSPPKPRQ
jgi:hypothetical protein